jgi:hypothetical protein
MLKRTATQDRRLPFGIPRPALSSSDATFRLDTPTLPAAEAVSDTGLFLLHRADTAAAVSVAEVDTKSNNYCCSCSAFGSCTAAAGSCTAAVADCIAADTGRTPADLSDTFALDLRVVAEALRALRQNPSSCRKATTSAHWIRSRRFLIADTGLVAARRTKFAYQEEVFVYEDQHSEVFACGYTNRSCMYSPAFLTRLYQRA